MAARMAWALSGRGEDALHPGKVLRGLEHLGLLYGDAPPCSPSW